MKKELLKLLRAAALCALICLIISAGVALLLRTQLFADMRVFLFRLIRLEALCCVVLLAAVYLLVRAKGSALGLEFSSAVLCLGLSAAVMALFFALGPTSIERSYTVYSLADMAEHAKTVYSSEDIKTRFIDGYVEGADESQKRIDEQVSIGNLEEADGGYRITPKGERLVRIFRAVETIFPVPDENSIYPNGH